jgi:DNA repair exonuclease SbcCD ATPase subunit
MVLAIVAAAGMAADFAWDLGGAVRWGIWVAWVLSGGVVLAIGVVRPMVRRLPAFDLAAAAEDGHPELGESLTGAVALLGEGAPHGSPELIDALADRAARSIPSLRPVGAISGARAVRRLGLGLLMVGLVVVPALVRPGSFGVLARRFLMPWADIGRLARFVVAVEPGDRVVAAGSEVTFTAEVRPLLAAGFGQTPESARLTWEAEAGQGRQSLEMSPQPGSGPGSAQWLDSSARRFTLTMPRVGGTIEYRVTSGPASSRRHRITALEPPAAGSIAARIEPPAYTGRTAGQARDPARIEAFEGSRVTLEIAATRPVRSVEVGWPGETGKPSASMPATLADGGRRASVSVVAMASGPYSLEMRDEHGIGSRPDDTRRLIVQPDTPPVVSVRGVDELKEVNPRDTVNLGFTARDDVAVASVEMHYTVVRAGSQSAEPEAGRREVATTGLGSPTARGVAALSMGPMGLKPGDRVSYRLRVADNRPAPKGPNVTWTPAKELAVIAGAEPIAVRLARLRRSAIESALERLNKDVAAGRQDTERMRQAAESSRRGEARWDAGRRRAVEQRERTLRDVIERLKQLARKMAEDPATRELARPARQIAELEAEASRAMLERARHEDDPARISENLRQAENRLASAAERLEELRRRFHEQDREVARRGKLQELADRQQRLAEESEAEPPRGRVELDRLQARQNAVRNELDALVRQTPELRGSLLEAEAREADRLVRAARELAARQREEARRAGDPSPHAAELKAIAAEQRRLEDDARRVALDVDPPLTENGRGRLNVGEIRQAAEPIERGDVEQARQRLEAAENELRRLARDVEDLPGDPKSLAQRLVRRQDALNGEIGEALNRLREKDKLSKDEKDALADRLKSLGRRQESIAGLAASIRPPEGPSSRSRFPEQAMREAVDKTRRAAEAFRQPVAQVIDERKNEARQALDRLANELPDWWRRSEPDRQKFDEARRITNELFNQVSQHLRETEPRPDRPATAAKAAEELGRRLGDAPDRLAQGLRALREMEPEPRVQPQRDRAVRAGEAMERALRDLRDAGQREAARAALGAAEQQAHAAMDRLDHKLNGRSPADDLAAELARDQRELVDRLARGGGVVAEGASEDQRRIANALRDLNVPDAALDRADAVRQAERAARALARPGAGAGGLEAAKAATQAADRLAARLGGRPSSRERAAALARAERALDEPEALADPSALATRQRAIAAELALLPVVKKEEAAGRVAGALELDERAGQIDEEPGASRPSPSALAVAHERAAEALDALAARALTAEAKATAATSGKHPAGTAGPDPELLLKPDHVAAARDLVRRQRQLRERFLAVLGRHVEPQESVRRDSVAVGQELMQLRDRIRPISDRGVYPAFEAAHHLRAYAAQAMEQAAEHLAQGQVPYARDAQRRASESIERGAQHAEDLGAALRAEQMAMAAAAPTATAGANRPLGAAREAIARAVRQVEQARDPSQAGRGAAAAARAAMREAARDLMAAAQEADPGAGTGAMADLDADGAGDPLEPGSQPPASSPRDGPSRPGQAADTDLAELKDAIRRGTGRTWGELPGHLRTEILQSAHGGYREDYARLIQLYFREIASGAGAKPVE